MLKKIFAFDSMVVATSGISLLALSGPFADILDWERWVVLAIGAALIAYFPIVFSVVRSKSYSGPMARLTFAGDVAWVFGSIVVIVLLDSQTAAAGKWVIAGAALLVADIGLVKLLGWRNSEERSANEPANRYSVA